jgi:hypothetical protein
MSRDAFLYWWPVVARLSGVLGAFGQPPSPSSRTRPLMSPSSVSAGRSSRLRRSSRLILSHGREALVRTRRAVRWRGHNLGWPYLILLIGLAVNWLNDLTHFIA